MFVRMYDDPKKVGGWLGWLEDKNGNALGYIHADGSVLFMGGVQ